MISVRFFLLFSTIVLVNQVTSNKPDDTKKSKQKEYAEIVRGNCKEAKDKDMVYHEVVIKNEVPFIKRNATSSWFGDHQIYCVKALNELKRKDKKGGGTALIKEGGVGHNFVTIEMHSEAGQPIEFLVLVYGEKIPKGKKSKLKHKKA